MRIIEIAPLSNGAHRNQNGGTTVVPSGWAIIRDGEKLKNFPFGSFEVEHIDGVPHMKRGSWTPGEMPVPKPEESESDIDPNESVYAELDAAYQEGVNSAYDE